MNEPTNETRRLHRLKDGRIVAGVCTGLAAYAGIDATLIRLGFALLTAFGGLGVLLFQCAWIVIPMRPMASRSPGPSSASVGPDYASLLLRAQYGRTQSSLCRGGVCPLCWGSPPAG
jgi:phage shock protein PspC (stress-responsive transcriptional regulator)